MPKKPSIPAYKLHVPSGQARVIIAGKHYYLGKYDSPDSHERYGKLIAEWKASNKTATPERSKTDDEAGPQVVEVVVAFWDYAERHYIKNGQPTSEQLCIKAALRLVRKLYGSTPARAFGPLALKAVRAEMVDSGLSRGTVNRYVDRIRRMFRWAASEEMLPVSVHQALATVPGLQEGRTTARESAPILPVDDSTIEATLEHLPQVVADMVCLQRLIGARPGEVCNMRPMDINTTGEVWTYIPASHKTQHHGRQRIILIGPKAQDILRSYLLRAKDVYCFSPADSEKKRHMAMRETRKSKVQPSQVNRSKSKPKRTPSNQYDKDSYARAVRRAAMLADRAAKRVAKLDGIDVMEGERLVKHWHPNQLRHAAATAIRAQYGLEAAQVILGHSKADTTQIYAERDLLKAAAIMKECG